MDSSVLINTTEAMLRNLEQDTMSAQSSFRSREDGSVMSNPNPWGAAERPAGWLGDAIRSRSSSNLRASSYHSATRNRSRSRSNSGRRHRSRLKEKRDKVRREEQKYDEMKQSRSFRSSRSKRGVECDASTGSLSCEEFF